MKRYLSGKDLSSLSLTCAYLFQFIEENPQLWFVAFTNWIEAYQKKIISQLSFEQQKTLETPSIKSIESWQEVIKILIDNILPFAWHLPTEEIRFLDDCWKPNHPR